MHRKSSSGTLERGDFIGIISCVYFSISWKCYHKISPFELNNPAQLQSIFSSLQRLTKDDALNLIAHILARSDFPPVFTGRA